MLRSLSLCAVLGAFAFAPAQRAQNQGDPFKNPRLFATPATGSEGWKKAPMTPAKMAATIDARVAALSGVWFGYLSFDDVPEGKAESQGVGLIVSPQRYHLEYITYRHRRDAIGQGVAIADGKRAITRTGGGWSKSAPVGQIDRLAGRDLLKEFPIRFDEFLFAGVGNRKRPLTAYVAAIQKPSSGYAVSAEARAVKGRATSGSQYRLLVRRAPALAKRVGPMVLELVFDAGQKLPVSARMTSGKPKAQVRRSWGVQWSFGGLGRFDPQMFVIPAGL